MIHFQLSQRCIIDSVKNLYSSIADSTFADPIVLLVHEVALPALCCCQVQRNSNW